MSRQTRTTLWLKANGKINTLRRHMINAGYRAGYETTIAKQQKCKPSDIPLNVIGFYLGSDVEVVEMPDNWQTIMYGTPLGAQKNRKRGQAISKPTLKEMGISDKVETFLTMRLTRSPETYPTYY